MKNKIEWFDVKDKLPEENGRYPVYGISMRGAQPIIRIAEFRKGNKFNKSEWLSHYPYITVLKWSYPIEKPKDE